MQPPEGAQVDLGKAQVIDRVPKVIKELKFGVMYAFVSLPRILSEFQHHANFVRLIQVQR